MNPADLANWKCMCGKGPSIAHQVNGYCPYKEGYAAAIEDAAKVADKYATEYVFSFAQVAKEIRALLSKGTK